MGRAGPPVARLLAASPGALLLGILPGILGVLLTAAATGSCDPWIHGAENRRAESVSICQQSRQASVHTRVACQREMTDGVSWRMSGGGVGEHPVVELCPTCRVMCENGGP